MAVTGPRLTQLPPPQPLCSSRGRCSCCSVCTGGQGPSQVSAPTGVLPGPHSSLASAQGTLGRPPSLGPFHFTQPLNGRVPLASPLQTLKTRTHFLPQWLLQEAESLSRAVLSRGDCRPGAGLTVEGILDSDGGWALKPLGLLLGPEGFKTEEKPTEIKSKGPEQSWQKARTQTICPSVLGPPPCPTASSCAEHRPRRHLLDDPTRGDPPLSRQ